MRKFINKHQITIIFVLCIFAAGYFFYEYLFQSEINKNSVLRQEINQTQKDIKSADAEIAMLENHQRVNEELYQKLQAIENKFKLDIKEGLNYFYIGGFAQEKGLVIENFYPQSPLINDLYVEFPIKMSLVGNYQQFIAFLKDLESNLPNMTVVKKIHIASGGASGLENQVALPNSDDSTAVSQETKESENGSWFQAGVAAEPEEEEEEISVSVIDFSTADLDLSRISEVDQIVAEFDLATFMVSSPESIDVARNWQLGRFNVFEPTVSLGGEEDVTVGQETIPGQTNNSDFEENAAEQPNYYDDQGNLPVTIPLMETPDGQIDDQQFPLNPSGSSGLGGYGFPNK